jgi:hypothetical protein
MRGAKKMTNQSDREAMAAALDLHVLEESEILQDYHVLSDKLTDRPLRVLVDHVVTEKEMHHFLLGTLCDWLRAPVDPVDSLSAQGLDRDAILRQTEALKKHELKTVEACRELKGRIGDDDRDLFATILEAVALDSEKHHLLLTAVERLTR